MTGGEQFRTRGAMNGTINTASAKQAFIRRIDDRIDVLRDDVAFDDL